MFAEDDFFYEKKPWWKNNRWVIFLLYYLLFVFLFFFINCRVQIRCMKAKLNLKTALYAEPEMITVA
ncbi:hypothetical protein HMPREF1020_04167 [Clostridium sp. 7_3_54FAA]|nr:hypothetical protein HMPREF1020_04167 [Clostridium sp. 7_3_54FAA]